MFDAIFSILSALTSSARQAPDMAARVIDFPKSNPKAMRRDWDNIQKDWEAIGIDMQKAIHRGK